MTLIKSISGIRGTIGGPAGDGLNPLDIVKFTSAYATLIRKTTSVKSNKIVVGRDARISGEMVKNVVCGTLMGMGFDVVNIGLASTPTTELAVTMEGACGELSAEMEEATDFRSMRDALVVLFLYATGIRLAELIAIDRTDFGPEFRELHVTGKGDRERMVPVVPELRRRLFEYMAAIKRDDICKSGEKALFLTEQGRRISRTEVYRIVRGELTALGVQGKRSPHVLRHTFATHLMNGGADLREIQELLGHGSLNATQVYTHNSIAQLKEVYAGAHPRGNRK